MPEQYEVVREGEETILRVNYEDYPKVPSLEDDANVMSSTVDKLIEAGTITRIVFYQHRDYEYEFDQAQVLLEIARLFAKFSKQREVFSYESISLGGRCKKFADEHYTFLQDAIHRLLKRDPIGAYVELKRELRDERIRAQKFLDPEYQLCSNKYVSILTYVLDHMEKTKLVQLAKSHITGLAVGDRAVYRKIFRPIIKPDFMYTKVMSGYPVDGEEIASYTVNDTEITIFKQPDTVQYLYHMNPPEFKLSEEKYELLDLARKILAEHKPSREEFVEPERLREVFYNVGRDLIEELANFRGISLRSEEIEQLAQILVRYTIGFGLIEVLLADDKIQDITINSPMGRTPMFIVHSDFADCRTNIIPTRLEAESWASKLRLMSGRPLDEANPILDTEIELPGARARIAVIAPPLNPTGLAYAFRRHRDKPWTLPLFMKNNMLNPLAAGILSFLVDGSRTMLVAGTRSAGKTSLLASLVVEIMRKYRIITIEDTLELPVDGLRGLGYNIQQMKVASAVTRGTNEVPADEGIRTTLRLGDSALIVGEVRSTEAKALYEAMRVGALANVVAGTIHGDSPYGVFDRVVNDLQVPRTSFKATDVIVVANPVRSADGMHRWRRLTSITEVRKHWEDDPSLEHGFVDLMKYDAKTDQLNPSADLLNGDSDVLKSIAGNVKEWAGNWDAVWDNILLRAKTKELIVEYSNKLGDSSLLEADFVILANDAFHIISDVVKEEVGYIDSKRVLIDFNSWLARTVKKRAAELRAQ